MQSQSLLASLLNHEKGIASCSATEKPPEGTATRDCPGLMVHLNCSHLRGYICTEPQWRPELHGT